MKFFKHALVALVAVAVFSAWAPFAAAQAAPTQASYRYNRVAATYVVEQDGSVRVTELITMLFDGSYSSMWRVVPIASSTISDVKLFDASAATPLSYTAAALPATDPASWNKFTYDISTTTGVANVRWFFNTRDRVHSWALSYTLRGAVALYPDHDELFIDVFNGADAPVDTVEATITLPGAVQAPQSNVFTSGGHDFYIDRPDAKTFRYRVSGMSAGERVSLYAGWQKGLVHPRVPLGPIIGAWLTIPLVRAGTLGLAVVVALGIVGWFVLPRGWWRGVGSGAREWPLYIYSKIKGWYASR